ncbi:hypothetical protein V5O48_011708 [Marasmius crinis-equi]|uniref:Uncharacterized protein n=1 Tax=Marasmius crinis-equi TaxID=585013 RepID=A0ABR3F591_9AGAR
MDIGGDVTQGRNSQELTKRRKFQEVEKEMKESLRARLGALRGKEDIGWESEGDKREETGVLREDEAATSSRVAKVAGCGLWDLETLNNESS